MSVIEVVLAVFEFHYNCVFAMFKRNWGYINLFAARVRHMLAIPV